VPRQRLRPTRRQQRSDPPAPAPGSPPRPQRVSGPKPKPAWRETIDSFGGFLTVGAIIGAVVIVIAIFITQRPEGTSRDVSEDALVGTTVEETDPNTDRLHVSDPALLQIPDGEPPVRGPHYAQPQRVGVYEQPVPDGNAIHSLEHGIVWISYNPELLNEEGINALEALGEQYGGDTIIAPRPLNATAIAAASWGQRLKLDGFDTGQLEDFIRTNRNRAPEPFVR
jgi:hypothetical protein